MLFLTTLYLTASRTDPEDSVWFQILIFIIVAIVGTLQAKRKAPNKSQPAAEPPQARPAKFKSQYQYDQRHKAPAHAENIKPQKKASVLPTLPAYAAAKKTDILTDVASSMRDDRIPDRGALTQQIDRTDTHSRLLHLFENPTDLMRAVLYHEILGPPVSLRD